MGTDRGGDARDLSHMEGIQAKMVGAGHWGVLTLWLVLVSTVERVQILPPGYRENGESCMPVTGRR